MIALVNTKFKTVLQVYNATQEAPARYTFPDNSTVSPIILGWSQGDYAVYNFVPFVTPQGKTINGNVSYNFLGTTVNEVYPVIDTPVPVYTRVLRSDIVRRLTSTEADNLLAAFNETPGKLRFLWDSVTYVDNTAVEYPELRAFLENVIGATRADEVLAPTE